MIVIATGLSGLIGSRIQELLGGNFDFVDFSLESGGNVLDLDKLKQALEENKEAEAVMHWAAFTDVNQAWKERGDKNGLCFKVNVLGTRNIASLCQQSQKFLIHISTDYVFNGQKPLTELYTEEDQPIPLEGEWYGQTKFWAEQEVQKSGCKFAILRTAFPFKARPARDEKKIGDNFKLDLVRQIIKKLQNKEKVKMFIDQMITPTFADDLIAIINKVINSKPEGVYHCVGTPIYPFEMAHKIAAAFSLDKSKIKESRIEDLGKDQRPRQKNLGLSNKKMETDLRIKMHTFEEALEIIKQQGVIY